VRSISSDDFRRDRRSAVAGNPRLTVVPDMVDGEPDNEAGSTGLELIAKVDAVMTALERRGEISAADLALVIDEPLSSTYRMLQSLTAIRWVDRGPRRGSYRLGLRLMTIGGLIEDGIDIRESALAYLRSLRDDVGATSFLCLRRDARAVCVERLEGQSVRSLAMQLGGSLPLYAGAAPRALLAFLPASEQRAVLRLSHRLPGDPPQPDHADLEKDLALVRKRGYAVSDGDVTPGVAALGAPVFNHRHELVAAISISGLRVQILGGQRRRNVRLIADAARAVSVALGDEAGA
jgi:DNA-binding IclR family transcriptional regulator